MGDPVLSVREMRGDEIELIVDYFLDADADFLHGMGVDTELLPDRREWIELVAAEFGKSVEDREVYYLLWLVDGRAVGHCNINKIEFGLHAFMHLHLWEPDDRRRGIGTELVRLSVPVFCETFRLVTLFCEPYALNPAPNRMLPKAGFELQYTYDTRPGWINFHQPVNRWRYRCAPAVAPIS